MGYRVVCIMYFIFLFENYWFYEQNKINKKGFSKSIKLSNVYLDDYILAC